MALGEGDAIRELRQREFDRGKERLRKIIGDDIDDLFQPAIIETYEEVIQRAMETEVKDFLKTPPAPDSGLREKYRRKKANFTTRDLLEDAANFIKKGDRIYIKPTEVRLREKEG